MCPFETFFEHGAVPLADPTADHPISVAVSAFLVAKEVLITIFRD